MWKENLAIQSFPTNAYGTITFDGSLSKAAKYVRLGPKSDMSKVKELLTEHWGLTRWIRLLYSQYQSRAIFDQYLIISVLDQAGWTRLQILVSEQCYL